MSIITELNLLRRDCQLRGVPGPHTYAIPSVEVADAAAELAVMMNRNKPNADKVTVETVTQAIFNRCLTVLNCKVIVAEMVGR